MAVRNFAKHPVGSAVGLLTGFVTVAGVVLAVQTDMDGVGAALIVGGFVALVVFCIVAARNRAPGEPL